MSGGWCVFKRGGSNIPSRRNSLESSTMSEKMKENLDEKSD